MNDAGDFGALGPGGWDDELSERCWFLASPETDRYRNNIEVSPEDIASQIGDIATMVVAFEEEHGIEFETPARSKTVPELAANASRTIRSALDKDDYGSPEFVLMTDAARMLGAVLEISDESFPSETRAHLRSPHLLLTWLDRLHEESKMAAIRPFQPAGEDLFVIRLNAMDRATVKRALERVAGAGEVDDPSIRPLFPDAYGDDTEKNEGWNALVRGELIESRSNAHSDASGVRGQKTATLEQLIALMRCLNDARLMMGVELNITDEEDHSTAMRKPIVYAQFERLGFLVAMLASALQSSL